MNAPARIVTFPIQPPRYDNTRLGQVSAWVSDNGGELARYWRQLVKLSISETDDEELGRWGRVQHEIEVIRREQLPHGSNSL